MGNNTKCRNEINSLSEDGWENRTPRPVYPTLIMSSLARSLLIVAAVEGLLLTPIHADSTNSPHVSRSRRATPVPSRAASPSPFACQSETVQVDYRTGTVRKLLKVNEEHRAKEREGGLEVHGIAGRPTSFSSVVDASSLTPKHCKPRVAECLSNGKLSYCNYFP